MRQGSDQPLPRSFFHQPTLQVAPALLGCVLARGAVRLRIVEVEAYVDGDSAAHSFRGRTARTAPVFGPAGHAYVYLCYGIHHLLNLVTEPDGVPGCVLIRGGVVVAGAEQVRARRGGRLDCIGPGKVGQALGLDVGFSGRALDDGAPDALQVLRGPPPPAVRTGPRVGIGYASPDDQAAPWRFLADDRA